jgi:hypothetical protein
MKNEERSVINLPDTDAEEEFKQDLLKQYVINNGLEDVEPWLDSQFNQIFVTYMYPDVTKVN